MQRTGEQLDPFITRLKEILKECDYGDEKEKQLRDQIVFGCREDSLRDKFFREAALTLQTTIHICTAHQASQKQINSFREVRDETVAKIRETKPADSKRKYKYENTQIRECKLCGRKHVWDKHLFPAYGKTCSQCGRENHFAANLCRANISKTKQPYKHVHAVHKDGHDEQEYVLKINDKSDDKAIMGHMQIDDKIIRFQVDPGASVNILPQ